MGYSKLRKRYKKIAISMSIILLSFTLCNSVKAIEANTKNHKNFSHNHLVMAWENATNVDAYNAIIKDENSAINKGAQESGLQIISPTIFKIKIKDNKVIGVDTTYSEDYLKRAKENQYKIWPAIQFIPTNQSYSEFEGIVEEFLNDNKLVDKVINHIYNFIKKYELTGVNIDFEALGIKNRQAFSNFMEKLYCKFSKGNLKVSVCMAYPSKGSPYFDFIDPKSINKNSDYIMFMAYDEIVVGNEVSGSISSYNWVEKGIKTLLELGINREKLVLGVPLYTLDFAIVEGKSSKNSVIVTKRMVNEEKAILYKDKDKKESIKDITYGDMFITEDYQKGIYKVRYKGKSAYIDEKFVGFINPKEKKEYAVGWNSISMKEANNILKNPKCKSKIIYDEIAKQDVLEYYKYDNANTVKLKHRIWLENSKSIEWRKELVNKYKLKGIGAWSLGKETLDVWSKLYK